MARGQSRASSTTAPAASARRSTWRRCSSCGRQDRRSCTSPTRARRRPRPTWPPARSSLMLDTTTCLPFIAAGRMRALAVASKKRNPALPDVPTFDEVGVPGVYASSWYGLMAPAGTPRPIIDKLNAEANQVLQSPDDAGAHGRVRRRGRRRHAGGVRQLHRVRDRALRRRSCACPGAEACDGRRPLARKHARAATLFEKIWHAHVVMRRDDGQDAALRRPPPAAGRLGAGLRRCCASAGSPVRGPERAFATPDHYVPTDARTLADDRRSREAARWRGAGGRQRRAPASAASASTTRARASCTWSARSRA